MLLVLLPTMGLPNMNTEYILTSLEDLYTPKIIDGVEHEPKANKEMLLEYAERLLPYTQNEKHLYQLIHFAFTNANGFPCTAEECLFDSLQVLQKLHLTFSCHCMMDIMACYCMLKKYNINLTSVIRSTNDTCKST